MDAEIFLKQLKNANVKHLIERILPVKIGILARDHFKENFRLGGFMDNNLKKWKAPQRYNASGKYAGQKYGPLLSARAELYNSINYKTGKAYVTIYSDKEYAEIHNTGGTTNPTVTPKMKKFAWAKSIEAKNNNDSANESKWKAIALTKKSKLEVKIPKRQFIGRSRKLDEKIEKKIMQELDKLLNIK